MAYVKRGNLEKLKLGVMIADGISTLSLQMQQ